MGPFSQMGRFFQLESWVVRVFVSISPLVGGYLSFSQMRADGRKENGRAEFPSFNGRGSSPTDAGARMMKQGPVGLMVWGT